MPNSITSTGAYAISRVWKIMPAPVQPVQQEILYSVMVVEENTRANRELFIVQFLPENLARHICSLHNNGLASKAAGTDAQPS